jgi:hypothetical protein
MHRQPVLQARWNPVRKGNLALCCGTRSVYTWSDEWTAEGGNDEEEEMAECIAIPASERCSSRVCSWLTFPLEKFETRDLRWAPDGKGFILVEKDAFCCGFEVEGDELVSSGEPQ